MADVNELLKRIDAEFDASRDKLKAIQTEKAQEHVERQQRLERFGALLGELVDVWRPRLEALRAKFGDRAHVTPTIEPGRRSAAFKFNTELARVDMRFSAFTDSDVRRVIFSYDLEILPIFMKFDSHSEIEFPIDSVDRAALAKWFDDRIVGFVRTYLSLHENQYYLKGHMVEDPVAKIQFPKYAAGAKLEKDGKTIYFIDERTRDEYVKRAGG
jgi:YHS domain-containing protein